MVYSTQLFINTIYSGFFFLSIHYLLIHTIYNIIRYRYVDIQTEKIILHSNAYKQYHRYYILISVYVLHIYIYIRFYAEAKQILILNHETRLENIVVEKNKIRIYKCMWYIFIYKLGGHGKFLNIIYRNAPRAISKGLPYCITNLTD